MQKQLIILHNSIDIQLKNIYYNNKDIMKYS